MASDVPEVFVAGEHCEVVMQTELGQQRIDRTGLYSPAATTVSQIGGLNMILTGRHQERYGGKAVKDLIARFWTGKPLKKLLQNKAGGNNRFARLDGMNERVHFRHRRGRIAPKRERPYAGVDKEGQSRDRSAL